MVELFDFELLDSAEDFVILGQDPMEQEVTAAETAQIAADQDEMAILADYMIPADKTPADLERDLEAMVSGITSLSLQAPSEAPAGLASPTSASPPTASSVVAEDASTVPSSRKRPLDQGDDAGVPAGASGPDTGIPSAGPSETGALVGGDHSRASAGASCPDTEPRPDASSSPVPASGALSLLGKQLPPVPSSTLRTSLDTEVPMEQRLQDPVTYSFAEDGNILLTNVMAGLPCLPKKLAQPLRSIQVGEIVELCLKFDVSKLTPPAFARIVEVYAIAKAKHLAQEIWEAKHLPKGARSMEKLTTLPEVEDKLPYMCASCFTSWILPAAKKCLHCASTEGKVPTALPSASVTVDGVTWTMTFDADKQLRWQSDAPDLGDTQKPLCSVEVSSLGQKPPTAGATPREVTFSELVSDSSRMTLRQEVLKRGDDEVFHKEVAKKPQGVMDHDPGQETVTFHPTNVKAMRLVSELRQAERREKKEARVEV